MALDTAIVNVGDYYAAHYLADKNGFEKDIADKTKRWKDQGSSSAVKRLLGLASHYFKAKSQALDYPDPERRNNAQEKELASWHNQLLHALGYQAEPFGLELESEQKQVPVLLRLNRHNQPWLVICATPFCLPNAGNEEEPLEMNVIPASGKPEGLPTYVESWEKTVAMIFKQEDRCRWTLLLSGSRIYLFDAHTYSQGRYLYVDLDKAYDRKQQKTFEAICALIAADSLAPESETDDVLHEKLREGSLKSTHGVSEKLQGAVRNAIETIANGWVEARRNDKLGFRKLGEHEPSLPGNSREVTAEQLRQEALIYVYRLLFCFYAEARGGELGILPINDDDYRRGYSLEALRDLVELSEPSTSSENGTYYAEHLNTLFRMIHQGFHPEEDARKSEQSQTVSKTDLFNVPVQGALFNAPRQQTLGHGKRTEASGTKTFIMQPLTATLFDPSSTPLINLVKLPNRVLYSVVRCLSLGTGDKSRRIGRINYAELGIVQLGSVYEGLLSYKGFFAKEDLIQVLTAPKKIAGKPQPVVLDNAIDPKTPTWFVPVSRRETFREGEIVIEHRTKKPRIYKTGEFILHLNGVDRVNSASYYTPEVLTRTLVREALKERLRAFRPEDADRILKLKICEPAMGSAAFLVEAIDQLAHEYLRLKQAQLDRSINPSDYDDELRRVRHFLAVQNVYGVDLNPTAVELGALSLWLATIHRLKLKTGEDGNPDIYRPGATPWFGLRLRAGNSLIGARRAVWTEEQLITGRFHGKSAEAPRQLKPGEARKQGEVYHFLVWDEDMAPAANDKLMRQYWRDECETIRDWRNRQVKQTWSPEEIARARAICERIDRLWEQYALQRQKGLEQTECTATVWPAPTGDFNALKPSPTLASQEKLKNHLEAQSGAFQRLRLLMDSWCSFYFWPLQHGNLLPSRTVWLAAAEVLLGCDSVNSDSARAMLDIALGEEIDLEALFQETRQELPNTKKLTDYVPWFRVAREVDKQQHFHHWELLFTEVLGPAAGDMKPTGFDLMFGNPPWMKVTWNDAPLLSEFDALLGVREAKSEKYNSERSVLLDDKDRREVYRTAFAAGEGASVFLNDRTLYPALAGVQTNLYKNFIERSWALLSTDGTAGLLHPEGVFDDPKGGHFRAKYYSKLCRHYQFKNSLFLFSDVDSKQVFSINIYKGSLQKNINFNAIYALLSPRTVERCLTTPNQEKNPNIKNEHSSWHLSGPPDRIIHITKKELSLFAKLFEDEDVPPEQARLPQVHSQPLLKVLEKFASAPQRLSDLKGQYMATVMFDETYAQRDGIITRMENPTFQPKSTDEWVISGPHFFAGNPFNKTPRTVCTANGHYDQIDLETIADDYLPRAVYRPGDKDGNLQAFYDAIPEWPKHKKPYKDKTGQWQAGFWPIKKSEAPIWEVLLGETLKLYGMDNTLPGAKTARTFGYFDRWEGDVLEAIQWLKADQLKKNSKNFNSIFPSLRISQKIPNKRELLNLPKPLTAKYRYLNRKRAQPANERTLMPSILPKGATHVNAAGYTVCLLEEAGSLRLSATASSILLDFFVKVTGRGDIIGGVVDALPIISTDSHLTKLLLARYLRLTCLTTAFADLYEKNFDREYTNDNFTSNINLYSQEIEWKNLPKKWNKNVVLVSSYCRRQAQLEIDVLVALYLGVSCSELIQVYSVQFPVMKAYEDADQYDTKGQRLPNTTRKDAGAKELREALKNHDGESPITVSWEIDNGNETVSKTFYPPFNHVDRIEDYRTAYKVFSERLGLNTEEG